MTLKLTLAAVATAASALTAIGMFRAMIPPDAPPLIAAFIYYGSPIAVILTGFIVIRTLSRFASKQ